MVSVVFEVILSGIMGTNLKGLNVETYANDSPEYFKLLHRILKHDSLCDGLEELEYLDRNPENDCIIMDLLVQGACFPQSMMVHRYGKTCMVHMHGR